MSNRATETATATVEPDVVDEWNLRYEGFDPSHEGLREALCTLGNGYFATRGAAPESVADDVHYPGTYAAGVYNRRQTVVDGRTIENESIVNLPNWLPLTVRIDDGEWVQPDRNSILDYSEQLDLRRGVLTRVSRVRDGRGRVLRMHERRFVSMADPHVAGLEMTIVPEGWEGRLTVRSGLDGRIVNRGVRRYRELNDDHLVAMRGGATGSDTIFLSCETSQSGIRIAQAARTRVTRPATAEDPLRAQLGEPGLVAHEFTLDARAGEPITLQKVVTLFTSRDRPISHPRTEACGHVARIEEFDELLEAHVRAWCHLWRRFSIEIEDGGATTPLILHLHIFHLLQTVSLHTLDLDVGVPARGLHGEAYRGHIFWDELFIFPYLNLHLPQIVRSLLLYRCRRLPEARWAARQAGYRGAMYPWQSGSDGREESQLLHLNPLSGRWLPDASHLQHHINSAIAYSAWQYHQATHDIDFLATYGAEMILEIARFWASAARYNSTLDRYEITGVVGPDEYHDRYPGAPSPGLRNNSYTNVMAVWVLCRALELLELLPEPRRTELRENLELDDGELIHWEEISRKMRLIFHRDGVISQFEGYEDLAELEWDSYRARYGDISRLDRILESEGDTCSAYKASKQADVLMLFYLLSAQELGSIFRRLGYQLPPEVISRTVDYYMQRTSHGSTLSKVVHAWVLARSDRQRSWSLFEEALSSDLDDVQGGTTPEGIHLGAMAGTIDMLQRCYLGIEPLGEVLRFNPHLPTEIHSLTLDLRYHRRWLNVVVRRGELVVQVQDWGEGTVRIGLGHKVSELHPGQTRRLKL